MESRNAEKRQSSLRDKKTKKEKMRGERHKSSRPESNQPKRERERDMPEKEPEPSVPSFFFPPSHLSFSSLLSTYHFRHHPNDPPYPKRREEDHHQTLYNTTRTVHIHALHSLPAAPVFLVHHGPHSDSARRFIRLHTHTPFLRISPPPPFFFFFYFSR